MTSTTFTSGGQNYDRLLEAEEAIMSTRGWGPAGAGTGGGGDGDGDGDAPVADITAPQKMISAMSGSIFTSLLGEACSMRTVVPVN